MFQKSRIARRLVLWAGAFLAAATAPKAQAAFHLWTITEVYTNSSGTLQFIEFFDQFGGQEFVNNQSIHVTNVGGSQTHDFTIPTDLPGDSFNHHFLIGTAGIQAAGGPAPDYIMPNGFLFAAGGTISYFGLNGGPYSALPTDGSLSRTWNGGNAVNSPQNFAGQSGTVVVPEPAALALLTCGGVCLLSLLRRRI